MCGGAHYAALVGFSNYDAFALRPIVSIDLTSSDCTMNSTVDENGKMTINLKFE